MLFHLVIMFFLCQVMTNRLGISQPSGHTCSIFPFTYFCPIISTHYWVLCLINRWSTGWVGSEVKLCKFDRWPRCWFKYLCPIRFPKINLENSKSKILTRLMIFNSWIMHSCNHNLAKQAHSLGKSCIK